MFLFISHILLLTVHSKKRVTFLTTSLESNIACDKLETSYEKKVAKNTESSMCKNA
jgi:hypothetical protein